MTAPPSPLVRSDLMPARNKSQTPRQDANNVTDERRWQALLARDASGDGSFFYAVRTTGVYCRPGCTSRLPRRENVSFFNTSLEAESAGFRSCKRCQPASTTAGAEHFRAIEAACRAIRESETAPALVQLAAAAGFSASHFHRLFKQVTGITPGAYARAHRLNRFAEMLDAGQSVSAAVYDAGYQSISRVYDPSSAMGLGMTPAARRRGGQQQLIRFATAPSPIGFVLIAATERGVCSVTFGDNPENLVADLRLRFPAATIHADAATLKDWTERVVAFIKTPAAGEPDLPLDVRGTAFQGLVWQALRRIPIGTTTTYSRIAEQLGRPSAARAVARACASNPVAVVIPCHRVVRSDGALAGYHWGAERKRALLAREAAAATTQADGPG